MLLPLILLLKVALFQVILSLVDSRLQPDTASRNDLLTSFLQRGLFSKQVETELVVSLYVRLAKLAMIRSLILQSKSC